MGTIDEPHYTTFYGILNGHLKGPLTMEISRLNGRCHPGEGLYQKRGGETDRVDCDPCEAFNCEQCCLTGSSPRRFYLLTSDPGTLLFPF